MFEFVAQACIELGVELVEELECNRLVELQCIGLVEVDNLVE